ncbi:MAG: DMT family transporter [Paracoccaceae bacterium]
MRKARLDGTGLGVVVGVTLLLAINQIVVKEANRGFQPVFFAGLRSVLATGFVWAALRLRGRGLVLRRQDVLPGLLIGAVFALEFMGLFLAIDLTAVGRASVIFYSMPVWLGLLAHFFLPGERLNALRGAGLLLAFAGTAMAILSRPSGGAANLAGDLWALTGAVCWALTAFIARRSSLAGAGPEMQLFWMVLVSGPILVAVSPLFGPLLREIQPVHWAYLLFQAGIVVTGGFVAWLWLLSVYPAATVASFSSLTPVFAILLGHVLYGEPLTPALLVAVALIATGIVLVNRRG